MTSTAPGAHPPPEEVDALLDLSGGDARVAAHVRACEGCRQVRDDLREVRALLGAQARRLPPEPPDLGARIAAALAAEPPLRRSGPAAPVAAVPARSAPVTDSPRWDRSEGGQVLALPRRRRWPAYLAVAASVAVVGLGGTFLAGTLGGGGSDAGTAAELSSADAGDSGGGAAAPSVSVPPGSLPDPVATASEDAARSSGTEYTRDDLVAQASALLLAADNRLGTQETEPGLEEFADRDRADCLAAVGRSGVEPAATDVATYEGRPAVVLVLPSGSGYDVLVVPVGCGSGDDRVLADARLE